VAFSRVLSSAAKKDDVRKRKLLLSYLDKTRQRFMGLLVAVKWVSNKQDLLLKLSHIMTKLFEVQWNLDQPPSRLYAVHANLRDRT
jgi:hypothetical protein